MLEINSCSAGYDGISVLEQISLSVPLGKTGCIIGPSGCGKTTLLMLAAGLKRPQTGSVLLEGVPVQAGDRRVSLILQQYGLFPWFTVTENVAIGLRLRHVQESVRRAAVTRQLSRLGLSECAHRYPNELSGGQQQRVAIARSMALTPRLLLMDEPFSALDAMTRESLQDILLEMLEDRSVTALIVTHSIEEAVYLGGTIWLLAGSPARIVASFDNPAQGRPAYRTDPSFFRLCTGIRERLELSRVI
jgi:NitT/TauT family transport system ATP-binding protein